MCLRNLDGIVRHYSYLLHQDKHRFDARDFHTRLLPGNSSVEFCTSFYSRNCGNAVIGNFLFDPKVPVHVRMRCDHYRKCS